MKAAPDSAQGAAAAPRGATPAFSGTNTHERGVDDLPDLRETTDMDGGGGSVTMMVFGSVSMMERNDRSGECGESSSTAIRDAALVGAPNGGARAGCCSSILRRSCTAGLCSLAAGPAVRLGAAPDGAAPDGAAPTAPHSTGRPTAAHRYLAAAKRPAPAPYRPRRTAAHPRDVRVSTAVWSTPGGSVPPSTW